MTSDIILYKHPSAMSSENTHGLRYRERQIDFHRCVFWWAKSPILELQTWEQLSHGQTPRLLEGWALNLVQKSLCRERPGLLQTLLTQVAVVTSQLYTRMCNVTRHWQTTYKSATTTTYNIVICTNNLSRYETLWWEQNCQQTYRMQSIEASCVECTDLQWRYCSSDETR